MSISTNGLNSLPILNEFFDDNILKARITGSNTLPLVNVIEAKGEYVIELAVPGYTKENINVSVENNVLTISGSILNETTAVKRYVRQEFLSNTFSRSFTLPENVNIESIVARCENGMLWVTLAKIELETVAITEVSVL